MSKREWFLTTALCWGMTYVLVVPTAIFVCGETLPRWAIHLCYVAGCGLATAGDWVQRFR